MRCNESSWPRGNLSSGRKLELSANRQESNRSLLFPWNHRLMGGWPICSGDQSSCHCDKQCNMQAGMRYHDEQQEEFLLHEPLLIPHVLDQKPFGFALLKPSCNHYKM
eukprot:2048669-Amphidinium_carterae.2